MFAICSITKNDGKKINKNHNNLMQTLSYTADKHIPRYMMYDSEA